MVVLSNESGDCYQTANLVIQDLSAMIHNAHSDCFAGVSTVSHFAPLKYSQCHYQIYQICIYQTYLHTYLGLL